MAFSEARHPFFFFFFFFLPFTPVFSPSSSVVVSANEIKLKDVNLSLRLNPQVGN